MAKEMNRQLQKQVDKRVTYMFRFMATGVLLLTMGCSVAGDENTVSIGHSAEQDIAGQWAAETHCAKYGKIPRLLRISPTTSSLSSLYFRSKTSVYACVDKKEP